MKLLVDNPAFDHISLEIFQYLDAWSISQCYQVSRSFREFITEQPFWPVIIAFHDLKTQKVGENEQFIEKYPHWENVFWHMETKENVEIFTIFTTLMQDMLSKDLYEFCPWVLAAKERNLPLIQCLIKTPFDFNFANEGVTTLHHACTQGHTDIVKFLLENNKNKSINTNATDFNGWTPFIRACKNGKIDTVKSMIEMADDIKLDISKSDVLSRNALHYACESGIREVVNLVQKFAETINVNLHTPDHFGRLPKLNLEIIPVQN